MTSYFERLRFKANLIAVTRLYERAVRMGPKRAVANVRKHGATFETAALAFADPFALVEQDRIEGGEHRWQTLGMAQGVLLLLVAHTFRDEAKVDVILIISARLATRPERRRYKQENR